MNKNLIVIGASVFLLIIGMMLIIHEPSVSYSTETDIDWNPISLYETEGLSEEELATLPRSASQVETNKGNIEVYIMESSHNPDAEIEIEEIFKDSSEIKINVVMNAGFFSGSEDENSFERNYKKITIPEDQFEEEITHVEIDFDEEMGSTEEQLIRVN